MDIVDVMHELWLRMRQDNLPRIDGKYYKVKVSLQNADKLMRTLELNYANSGTVEGDVFTKRCPIPLAKDERSVCVMWDKLVVVAARR